MTEAAGTYHDGRTSAARAVRVRVADGLVHIDGDEISTAFPLAAVALEPRLGGLARRLDLPNGASCQVPADFELPTPGDGPARMERWVNEAEIRWMPAVVATVLIVAGLYTGIVYGVPNRNYSFDINFLDPSKLPPLTPAFRDINALGFSQETRPGK